MRDPKSGIEYSDDLFLVSPGDVCFHLLDLSRDIPSGQVEILHLSTLRGTVVRFVETGEEYCVTPQKLRAIISTPATRKEALNRVLKEVDEDTVETIAESIAKTPNPSTTCDHTEAMQWAELLWCPECGAICPFEAKDLPTNQWTLPAKIPPELTDTVITADIIRRAERRAAKLQHYLVLITAASQLAATRTPATAPFLRGLQDHIKFDGEQLGLSPGDDPDLMLLFAQTSDALREILR